MASTDSAQKKRESYTEWEEIKIKPPIDMIPDEFTRIDNHKILVELICSSHDLDAQDLKETLEGLGYWVNETDKDLQKMDKKADYNWLKAVINKTEKEDYDGLIMIFAKVNYDNETMKNIWSQFTSRDCPKLKNKPKIFLFQILKRSAETDSTATSLNWMAGYETPAEADVLIINDMYDPDISPDLMQVLSENIQNHGYREDIISLISIGSSSFYHPMIISTMTRKFFFRLHEHRGHHHNVLEKQDKIKEHLAKLKEMKNRSASARVSPAPKKRHSFQRFMNFLTRSPDEGKGNKSKTIVSNGKTKEPRGKKPTASSAKSESTPSARENSSKKQDNTSKIMEGGSNEEHLSATSSDTGRKQETGIKNVATPAARSSLRAATSPNRSRPSSGTEKHVSTTTSSQSQRSSRKMSTASSVSITSISSKQNVKPPWKY